MLLQKFGVVRKPRQIGSLQMIQRIGERHLTEMMMMAIAFTIRRDIDQLRPVPRSREPACQALCKMLTVVQQMLESHRLRNRTVIKIRSESSARRKFELVCSGRINALAVDVFPRSRA